jgi:tripartite-type tricarboxylate transporter receptor subunit TctC
MRILGALAAALPLLLMPAPVAAQDFPTKPIKLIVPFPPGGPNDIIARVVGQRMTELMTLPPTLIQSA